MPIANSSGLGAFILGAAKLGTAPKQMMIFDGIGIGDSLAMNVKMPLADGFGIADSLALNIKMPIADGFGFIDSGKYLTDYFAGCEGTITVVLDIRPDIDWCEMVLEGGMTITVNGVLARAFVFIKQVSQSFDIGIQTLPGDAVMFTCPDDPVIAIGDEIGFAGYIFKVLAGIPHYWANNIIYWKFGLMRERSLPNMPQVTGLIISENLKGKIVLTWDAISSDYLPWFDHYEVWESLVPVTTNSITSITNPTATTAAILLSTAYGAGEFVAGQFITVQGSDNNDGDYVVTGYGANGGKGEVFIGQNLSTTGTMGAVINLINHILRGEPKVNKLTVQNLTPLTVYYYMVRGVDKHGNKGYFSAEVATPVDTTGPDEVSGLR